MLVLGIESTCDETACAIVRDGKEILSNIISSQIDLHKEFGGVVPELACRRHIDVIIPVIDEALKSANVELNQIDLISVAYGPGLIGALLIGLNTAKALSIALNKPFIGINHIEAHLYAALMSTPDQIQFPCIGAVLSGGHTTLILIKDIGTYQLISQTVDDAVGEAFDKVAKMLELPYPGGPQIEALARAGNKHRFPFKGGHVKGSPLDFSFSGLKTAVLYTLKGQNNQSHEKLTLTDELKRDIAASFQHAALTDIVEKTLGAAYKYGCKTIIFGGGVTNNNRLRELFNETSSNYQYIWPLTSLTLDNAAMIAGLAYHHYQKRGHGDSMDLEPLVRISF
ncbi:MAG: tRNA (adenosine(37)-N6)-threonylcarbamoyltransferase complex transferase subunit TsaD [Parachlamydiaceae bacterium]|nr:tRNA (adenosine(37)-N6)-threonylcarbamoyltransferase complex transferase subunit TsaD [Parachlamydiaceae bacterium]